MPKALGNLVSVSCIISLQMHILLYIIHHKCLNLSDGRLQGMTLKFMSKGKTKKEYTVKE